MMQRNSNQVCFKFNDYLFEQLNIISEVTGINKSEIVRYALLNLILSFDDKVKEDMKKSKVKVK